MSKGSWSKVPPLIILQILIMIFESSAYAPNMLAWLDARGLLLVLSFSLVQFCFYVSSHERIIVFFSRICIVKPCIFYVWLCSWFFSNKCWNGQSIKKQMPFVNLNVYYVNSVVLSNFWTMSRSFCIAVEACTFHSSQGLSTIVWCLSRSMHGKEAVATMYSTVTTETGTNGQRYARFDIMCSFIF